MTAFLKSLRSDLTDRRMLPVLVVLVAALAGALVYALSSSGGSSTTPSATAPSAKTGSTGPSGGIVVTKAETNSNEAVAETTNGAPKRSGRVRNPFKPPTPEQTPSASPTPTAGASTSQTQSSSSSTSSSSGGSSNTSSSSHSSGPSKPKQPKTVYHVSVLVGLAPSGSAEAPPPAKFDNLKRLTPLPSNNTPLVVFAGVTSKGKSATFQVVGEVIPRGPGACMPSPSQCEAVALQPGQTEQLEYLPLGGSPAIYQLQLLSISSSKASTAKAAAAFHVASAAGRSFMRRAGVRAFPGLRYSLHTGVLEPVTASVAVAHAAHRR